MNTRTLSDGSVVIELDNMDDWDAFKAANASELLAEYGSFRAAFRAVRTQNGNWFRFQIFVGRRQPRQYGGGISGHNEWIEIERIR